MTNLKISTDPNSWQPQNRNLANLQSNNHARPDTSKINPSREINRIYAAAPDLNINNISIHPKKLDLDSIPVLKTEDKIAFYAENDYLNYGDIASSIKEKHPEIEDAKNYFIPTRELNGNTIGLPRTEGLDIVRSAYLDAVKAKAPDIYNLSDQLTNSKDSLDWKPGTKVCVPITLSYDEEGITKQLEEISKQLGSGDVRVELFINSPNTEEGKQGIINLVNKIKNNRGKYSNLQINITTAAVSQWSFGLKLIPFLNALMASAKAGVDHDFSFCAQDGDVIKIPRNDFFLEMNKSIEQDGNILVAGNCHEDSSELAKAGINIKVASMVYETIHDALTKSLTEEECESLGIKLADVPISGFYGGNFACSAMAYCLAGGHNPYITTGEDAQLDKNFFIFNSALKPTRNDLVVNCDGDAAKRAFDRNFSQCRKFDLHGYGIEVKGNLTPVDDAHSLNNERLKEEIIRAWDYSFDKIDTLLNRISTNQRTYGREPLSFEQKLQIKQARARVKQARARDAIKKLKEKGITIDAAWNNMEEVYSATNIRLQPELLLCA